MLIWAGVVNDSCFGSFSSFMWDNSFRCNDYTSGSMWLPTVAELLKVLREQMEFWADRLGTTTDDVEYWCEEAAKKIAAFEARSKEAAAVS